MSRFLDTAAAVHRMVANMEYLRWHYTGSGSSRGEDHAMCVFAEVNGHWTDLMCLTWVLSAEVLSLLPFLELQAPPVALRHSVEYKADLQAARSCAYVFFRSLKHPSPGAILMNTNASGIWDQNDLSAVPLERLAARLSAFISQVRG